MKIIEADFCCFATYNFNCSTSRYNLPLHGAEPDTLACLSFAGVARNEFGHLEDVSCTVWFLNPFHIQWFSHLVEDVGEHQAVFDQTGRNASECSPSAMYI